MPRRRWIVGVLALATCVVVAAVGCGEDEAGSAPARGGEIEGRWVLTHRASEGALRELPSGAAVDATFAEGRVSGRAQINSYTGTYVASEGGDLDVGPLASTQMAGAPQDMEAEREYLTALEGAASFLSDGDTLTLYAQTGDTLLVYERGDQARAIVGSWTVTGYNDGRQAVVSPIAGSAITAAFAADGALTGDAGVNTYSTRYEISERTAGATSIGISPPATTRRAGPQALMDQEQRYLRALESAATFTIRGEMLEMRDRSDAIAVTMTR